MKRFRGFVMARPVVAVALGLVVGLVIGAGVEATSASDKQEKLDSTKKELASTKDSLRQAESARDAARGRADAVTGKRDAILSAARDRASKIVNGAKSELRSTSSKLDDAKQALADTQSKLDSVNASLDTARETKAKSSFGDGIWRSGADFIPGTYQAPGSSDCYWAKLNSGNTDDIADNNIGNGQQVTDIETPFFESQDCGTWHKVG